VHSGFVDEDYVFTVFIDFMTMDVILRVGDPCLEFLIRRQDTLPVDIAIVPLRIVIVRVCQERGIVTSVKPAIRYELCL